MSLTRWAAMGAALVGVAGCGASPPDASFTACREAVEDTLPGERAFLDDEQHSRSGDGWTLLVAAVVDEPEALGQARETYLCEVTRGGTVTTVLGMETEHLE